MGSLATWAALITAVGAAIGVVIQWRRLPSEQRQTDVTTDLAVSHEARQLLAELRKERDDMRAQTAQWQAREVALIAEVADLRAKYETVRAELSSAELKITRLETWVRAQGADPIDIYGQGT